MAFPATCRHLHRILITPNMMISTAMLSHFCLPTKSMSMNQPSHLLHLNKCFCQRWLFKKANKFNHFISRMSKEAILLTLLLLGLVTAVLTAPTENPLIITEHTPIAEIVSIGATPSDRLKRLNKICHDSGVMQASYCLAFEQLQNHLAKQNIIQKIDSLGRELAIKVTRTEDICSNLTELVEQLPSTSRAEELKSFAQDERCYSLCSNTNGSEDEIQSDDCRLLYVGFKALTASHPERERIENVKPKISKEKQSEKPVGGNSKTTQTVPTEENATPKTHYIQEEEERRKFVKKLRMHDPNDLNNQNYYVYFLFSVVVLGILYGVHRCQDDTKKV